MSDTSKTYLTLLTDIVEKKEKLLGQLILDSMKQETCFQNGEFNEPLYDEIYQQKMSCIQEIESLDEGFCNIYERVKEGITNHKYAYEEEIKGLQMRIRKITEMGLRLNQLENENRQRFEAMLATQKKRVKDYKVSKQTAAAYYKSMMKLGSNEPVFYNRKN